MAANYVIMNPILGVPTPVTETGTVQKFPLGAQVQAFDRQSGSSNLGAGIFQYCAGYSTASSAARGKFVQIRGNNAWILLAAQSTFMAPVGVAAGDLSNTNVYGWVQVQGIADYCTYAGSDVPAGKPQYICAGTGGIVLSNQVPGNMVVGVIPPVSLASASSASNVGTYQLNFPWVLPVTAANT